MKLIKSKQNINPFGGINFIIDALRKKGIAQVIDEILGRRPKQATYSYSDIILFWIYCNLCGGTRLEDSHHFKKCLKGTPELKMPSPDAIGRVFKSLATENTPTQTKTSRSHLFNNNESLLNLLLSITLKLGVLDKEKSYTLDYDNTIIETEKYDVMTSYEKTEGYQPGVSFIGKVPVYIQGRNGNAVAHTAMSDTLSRNLAALKCHGIKVGRFRSDSAAYQTEVVRLMDENGIDFFIRGRDHINLRNQLPNIRNWEKHSFKGREMFLASIEYKPFGRGGKVYRYVVKRMDTYEHGCHYRWIITNNRVMSNYEVFRFYNDRGKAERNFDALKNDFNWSKVPFSFLNENTVFMFLSAIANVIFLHSIDEFSKKLTFVKRNFRLKNFVFHFISVGAQWLAGRRLRIYSLNRYEVLLE